MTSLHGDRSGGDAAFCSTRLPGEETIADQIRNEHIKLFANWCNTIAAGIVAVGVFTPLAVQLYGIGGQRALEARDSSDARRVGASPRFARPRLCPPYNPPSCICDSRKGRERLTKCEACRLGGGPIIAFPVHVIATHLGYDSARAAG
jgi:hypothetical protein